MKFIRNILVIILAWALISNVNVETDKESAALESVVHSCDHSACEEEIALLETKLADAQQCCSVKLRVELEFAPGLLGDWAVIRFDSQPIRINQAACEGLEEGMDLSDTAAGEGSWMDKLIDCRIIVADIVSEA